ncbi:group II trans-sialidase superfamily, partial [Trypanosoma rangeli]
INVTVQEKHNNRLRFAYRPTTIAKGKNVFVLVGNSYQKYYPSMKRWIKVSQGLDLLVGEAKQDKVIQWGEPNPLLPHIEPSAKRRGVKEFLGGGGSGVVMEDGTLVFPVTARKKGKKYFLSMIIYSKDDGKNWVLSQGMLPVGCTDPLIVEWEQGQLVMVAKCDSLSKVFESRDMGATWTEAVRTLTRVHPRFLANFLQLDWSVASLTTATIAGKKVMLYTQRGSPSGTTAQDTVLYLWFTDNNRTFRLGPISMDCRRKWTLANTLLHSNDALHLLQEKGNDRESSLALVSLTEELKTITSVLETWEKIDSYLSNSSVPTAGLVGFLSDASGEGAWNDAYRCVNAIVTNAKKVENGFKFTGSESYAIWPVNMWTHHYVHSFVDYEFTLVATVTIDEVPNESVPLLGAGLEDDESTTFVGLSYTTEKRWETVFDGITTTHSSAWEPGKEYKVALMLQGNKGSVYVDGVLVGNTNKLPTLRSRRHDISHFYFSGGENSNATVKNVFLYNRPLDAMELKTVDDSDASEKRVGHLFITFLKGIGNSLSVFVNGIGYGLVKFWERASNSSDASEQRADDSSDASEQRADDSSDAAEQRADDSYDAAEQRADASSDASEQLAGDSSDAAEQRADDSYNAAEQLAGDSLTSPMQRAGDSSHASEQLPGDSLTPPMQRAGNSSSASEQRVGHLFITFLKGIGNSLSEFVNGIGYGLVKFGKHASNSYNASDRRAGDSSTLADGSRLLLLLLVLWGFAALC